MCTLRPIYSGDEDEIPDASLAYDELWQATGANYSGDEAVLKFRQAYEGRAVG